LGTALGAGASAYGIYGGLKSGTPTGYAQAGLGGASLANKAGAFGNNSGAAGGAIQAGGNILGLYTGLKQGGVTGDLQAANAAYGLATGSAGIPGVGQVLSVYNAIKGYQSGDTGGDALRGAEAGASIGSVVPVVGTILGGVIGGAVGAISSAFGPGKVDAENAGFNAYTQQYAKTPPAQQAQLAQSVQNPYQLMAGYFDLRSGQLQGQNPIYSTYGRMGEQKFTNDLVNLVNTYKSQDTTPEQMMNGVVQPWLNSMGAWNDSNKSAITSLIQNMTGQIMNGSYKQNFKSIGGQQVFH
jgi:hypothetical protein